MTRGISSALSLLTVNNPTVGYGLIPVQVGSTCTPSVRIASAIRTRAIWSCAGVKELLPAWGAQGSLGWSHASLPLSTMSAVYCPGINPTATLLEHLLLTQGFMSPSKAVSLIAGDRKIVILRGQFWATHSSVAVGLSSRRGCIRRIATGCCGCAAPRPYSAGALYTACSRASGLRHHPLPAVPSRAPP